MLEKHRSNHWMELKCHSENCTDVLNNISVDICVKQSEGFIVRLSHALEGRKRNTAFLPMGEGKKKVIFAYWWGLDKGEMFQRPIYFQVLLISSI